jgi:hypothetical protein
LLVIAATLIAFGLLPHEFIRALPVFSNNSWGRLVVVMLLGLSVLSAVGLELIFTELPALIANDHFDLHGRLSVHLAKDFL